MLVSDDPALVGNGNGNDGSLVQDDTLAPQSAFEPGVDGPIDKIFLLVGYLFQKIVALLYVKMTCGAGTHPPTVMVQVHIVLFRKFQDRLVLKITGHGLGGYGFIFK